MPSAIVRLPRWGPALKAEAKVFELIDFPNTEPEGEILEPKAIG
jgi:hypothetical protein